MGVQLRKLNQQVLVITGATSGIGLATAQMAAQRGATLVLSSRNENNLQNLCTDLEKQGVQTVYFVADVADSESMVQLANFAIQKFGRIDTWINNAGTAIYGKLTEITLAEKRRLFDVNFWGVVNGCRAALPHLKENGGALINLGSIVSERAIPLQGIYVASKHAIKGYTDSLRMELNREQIPVQVTLIEPTSVDTPYIEHAQNHMETAPKFPAPVYSPDVVAKAILYCTEHPKRNVMIGGGAKLFSMMETFLPRLTDKIMEAFMFQGQKSGATKIDQSQTGLFNAPASEGLKSGGYPGYVRKVSFYTNAVLHPVITSLILGSMSSIIYGLRKSKISASGIAKAMQSQRKVLFKEVTGMVDRIKAA